MKAERSEEQRSDPMQYRPGARSKGRKIGFVRACQAFRLVNAAGQPVPADRGSNGLLQIGAALPGLDQRRSQSGQQAHLVVDRSGIADQDILLANFRAAEHAADGTVEQGDGVVGQARNRVEHRGDQSRVAAQRRQRPQVLSGKPGPLAGELAQAFRVNACGAGRIKGDCAKNRPLLHETRKGAVSGSARRLTRPGQRAHRRVLLGRQQGIERLGLRRKQVSS